VLVSRPSKWGNPWRVGKLYVVGREEGEDVCEAFSAAQCVTRFRLWLGVSAEGQRLAREARRELRGKNLACWCPLDSECPSCNGTGSENAPGDSMPDDCDTCNGTGCVRVPCHADVLLEVANESVHSGTDEEAPNDPKLSDGGGLAQPVRGRRRQGAKVVGSTGCDSRSRSLQRMVRRCG
jgi:hypothetical protein